MSKHLKNLFTEEEVIEILERYLSGTIEANASQAFLKIKRRRFFDVLKKYRDDPDTFSLHNTRKNPPRQLPKKYEEKIESDLHKEKQLIDDIDTPIRRYNYSYIKNKLEKENINVSLSSIIRRAKKKGFINPSLRRKVMTERC